MALPSRLPGLPGTAACAPASYSLSLRSTVHIPLPLQLVRPLGLQPKSRHLQEHADVCSAPQARLAATSTMANTDRSDQPAEVASRVLRRAQVSKVALSGRPPWALCTNYVFVGNPYAAKPARSRQCEDQAWMAGPLARPPGASGRCRAQAEAARLQQRHHVKRLVCVGTLLPDRPRFVPARCTYIFR